MATQSLAEVSKTIDGTNLAAGEEPERGKSCTMRDGKIADPAVCTPIPPKTSTAITTQETNIPGIFTRWFIPEQRNIFIHPEGGHT